MKFVCMKCETYMNFEKVEKPAEGSLGVFFACPSGGARFTMVPNPGETQMVSSRGVQLGGRSAAPQPFEMTRGGLRGEGEGQAEMANYLKEHYSEKPAVTTGPAEGEKKTGGCPFSAGGGPIGLRGRHAGSSPPSSGIRRTAAPLQPPGAAPGVRGPLAPARQ